MQLMARRPMTYGLPARRLKTGDLFQAPDKDARLLILTRAAMETPPPRPDPEEPDEDEPIEQPEEPPRTKRKYTRRDLRAES